MNFRPSASKDVDVNLTPLIDVVFLLLIFFMVSTTFVKESKIDLTLPQSSNEVIEEVVDRIDVAIDKKGVVYVNDQALINSQTETIRKALSEAKAAADVDEPIVIISADSAATHQGVIDIMDAARQNGLFRVTFPTRIRKDD